MANKTYLIGNLTRDVELATSSNGKNVAKFSIAVKRHYRNEQGQIESDFINIVTFGSQAENCAKYLKKGSKISVIGRIQTGSYEKDGVKRYTFDIMAEEIEFLSTSKSTNDSAVDSATPELTPIDPDEDLPF